MMRETRDEFPGSETEPRVPVPWKGSTMTESKLTSAQEQCLRDQVIIADRPGPVLRDFRMLLDFVGPEGVEVGGKHHLLPMKFIGELDRRLSRPLHLELKRPQ